MGDLVTKAAAGDHGAAVRSQRQRDEDARGQNEAMRVLSHLIAGVLLYGALGWFADRWLETSYWLPIGVVLGAALAIFTIIRRFGATSSADLSASDSPSATDSLKERR